MSFSGEAKKEICKVPVQKRCCALAEAYGVLLFAHSFSFSEVKIVTANGDFAQRLPVLFKRAFSLAFDVFPEIVTNGKMVFSITSPEKIEKIMSSFGYDAKQHRSLHINFAVIEEDCCRTSFLRGAFLCGGSVTDPNKRYHLEFATPHLQIGREFAALLNETGIEPKSIERQGNAVTYFKHSDTIEDLLTLLGAPIASMNIMSAKIEKDMRNKVNRRMNCDYANADKSLLASRKQAEIIERLVEAGIVADLPVKLQEVAIARLIQPDISLSELAQTFDPPITKSCLNHRMRKLLDLAKEDIV